jgi:hypothetical protein
MMRKGRKEQRDFFKKMESGQLEEKPVVSREKRLVRNIKDVRHILYIKNLPRCIELIDRPLHSVFDCSP